MVHRVRYSELLAAPQAALRSCLEFVGEIYSADCLMPLNEKINSSNVPSEFDPADERTDPGLRWEAHELFEALEAEEPAAPICSEASMQLRDPIRRQPILSPGPSTEMARRLEMERRQQRNAARRRFRLFRGRAAG